MYFRGGGQPEDSAEETRFDDELKPKVVKE